MVICPECNSQMENIATEEYNGYGDAYFCESCNIEQAVFWTYGERVAVQRKDEDMLQE